MKTPGRWDVYLKSFCLCLGVCLANFLLNGLLRPSIHDATLRWATSVSVLLAIATAAIALYLVARRAFVSYLASIHEQIRPAIEERVMGLAFSGQTWSTPVPKYGPSRHVLEQCLAHALGGLRESSQDRLAQFAVEHGFARQWLKASSSRTLNERKRAVSLLGLVSHSTGEDVFPLALHDKQPSVRIEAARALLATGDAAAVDRVFRSVLREPLLARALLASDLKRHARHLLAHTIPAVLAENFQPDTGNCLELLAVWKLAIPGLDMAHLLERHRDQLVMPLVVALLPYASVDDSIEDTLLDALASTELEVQCAAARATGQLKLERMIPALVRLIGLNARLAVDCATALAQMGVPGARHLEALVSGSDRRSAAAAMEALETLTVGIH